MMSAICQLFTKWRHACLRTSYRKKASQFCDRWRTFLARIDLNTNVYLVLIYEKTQQLSELNHWWALSWCKQHVFFIFSDVFFSLGSMRESFCNEFSLISNMTCKTYRRTKYNIKNGDFGSRTILRRYKLGLWVFRRRSFHELNLMQTLRFSSFTLGRHTKNSMSFKQAL